MPITQPPWHFMMNILWLEAMGTKVYGRAYEVEDAIIDILGSSWFWKIFWKIFTPQPYKPYVAELIKTGKALTKAMDYCDELEEREKQALEEWKKKGNELERPMAWAKAIKDEWKYLKKHPESASLPMILAARTALQNYTTGECPGPVKELLDYREANGRRVERSAWM